MSSSLGLLDLANHLHNLESSFGKILIEAAVKLSQLTDINLFILMETPEGRKFSGKRHLCESYIEGRLHPIGNDVELVVDTGLETVSEKPHYSSSCNEMQLTQPVPPSAISLSLPNGLTSASVTDRKRKSNDSESRDAKTIRLTPKPPVAQLKQELTEADFHVISDDEDEALDNSFNAFVKTQGSPCPKDNCNTSVTLHERQTFNTVVAHSVDSSVTPGTVLSEGGNVLMVPNHASIILPDSLRLKLNGIATIDSPNIFTKTTMEYRLFASAVYDFGKLLFKYAPFPKDIKDSSVLIFIAQSVDAFLMNFPYLVDCDRQDYKIGGLTITGFVRDRAKNGFKKCLR